MQGSKWNFVQQCVASRAHSSKVPSHYLNLIKLVCARKIAFHWLLTPSHVRYPYAVRTTNGGSGGDDGVCIWTATACSNYSARVSEMNEKPFPYFKITDLRFFLLLLIDLIFYFYMRVRSVFGFFLSHLNVRHRTFSFWQNHHTQSPVRVHVFVYTSCCDELASADPREGEE